MIHRKNYDTMSKYHIHIDSYIGYPISKGYVRSKLSPLKGQAVNVRINSYGGSVCDGLDIRQQFVDHGDVTAYIFGMTASAATIIAMGAKRIVMSKYALMLVHCCSGTVSEWGHYNAEELKKIIGDLQRDMSDLEKIDQVIANLYALRTGASVKEMAELMAEGKWLSADDCLALGLIDEIIEEGEIAQVTDSIRDEFEACGLPVPTVSAERPSLMERIVAQVRGFFAAEKQSDVPQNVTTNQPKLTDMNKALFAALFACLAVETLQAAEDGSVQLSADQIQRIQDALAAADTLKAENETLKNAKAQLEAQVENLQKSDGDKTKNIEGDVEDKTENRRQYVNRMYEMTDGLA